MAQLAGGAVEYSDRISSEEQDFHHEYPGYNTKQSDSEAPVIPKLWGIQSTPSLPSLQVHSGLEW